MSDTTRGSLAGRLGGAVYITASVGFLVVFSWLAEHFGYPDVLDHPASEVLPQLLQLGADGRAVWAVYALLPLLLIPAAVGAASALRRGAEAATRLAVLLQVIAALTMMLGLARWSTAQWTLAVAWETADVAQRASITTVFDVLNVYLGNGIGEFVGELSLYSSVAAFGVALSRNGARWTSYMALVTAVAGLIGMFRNVTTFVQPAADITNVLLPGFLIMLGVALLRGTRRLAAT